MTERPGFDAMAGTLAEWLSTGSEVTEGGLRLDVARGSEPGRPEITVGRVPR